MIDTRCPEPKPVMIFLLGVGGAVGELLNLIAILLFSSSSVFVPMDSIAWAVITGSSSGLAAGIGVAVSKRFWFSAGAAVLFSSFGSCFALIVDGAILLPNWHLLYLGFFFGAPTALGALLSHRFFLLLRGNRIAIFMMPLGYLGMGALSALFFGWAVGLELTPFRAPAGGFGWASVGLKGAEFGIMQYLGMLTAIAVDRRYRRRLGGEYGQKA